VQAAAGKKRQGCSPVKEGDDRMPVVQVEMFAGRTLEQKRAMVKEVTEVFVKTINCKAEDVKIIIRELSRENLAEGGSLFIDK
jgi:4-oxalocrotonate tautomerase